MALAVSLPFQLFVVGRLVAVVGLRGAQIVYGALVAAAALAGWGEMTLLAAVFARFVEAELRYGLRNPLAQMTVNLFPKQVRTQARAWSLGFLIPATTLAASLALDVLLGYQALAAIGLATLAAGIGYLVAVCCLGSHIHAASGALRQVDAAQAGYLRRLLLGGSAVARHTLLRRNTLA